MATVTKEIYSELHHNFIDDGQGGVLKVVDLQAVESSIINILLTMFGERVMRRSFGSSLQNMVFTNMANNSIENICKKLPEEINRWDNRPIINAVNIQKTPDTNTVNLEIYFSVRGFSQVFQTTVTIKREQ